MTDTASRIVAIMSVADPAAEPWVQLLPMGKFQGKDGRGPYEVENLKAAEKVIAATLRHHGEADIVIDYDHQSDFGARPGVGGLAPAAGWITELEARPDGVWGRVEWTETASAKLRVREYRYLSPVFHHDPKTGAISKILRAGLTNNPNLEMKAVASANMSNPDHLAELRSLLSLTDTADLGAVVEAVRANAVKSVNTVDPTRFVPIEALQTVTAELNRINSVGTSPEAATIAVNSAIDGGKMPPALRAWGIEYCQRDRAAFDTFIGATAPMFSNLGRQLGPFGPAPGTSAHAAQSATGIEAEIARNLGLTVEEMKA